MIKKLALKIGGKFMGNKELMHIEHLLEYPIFHGMSHEQVNSVAKSIKPKNYKTGTQIWTEGEEGSDVALLLAGEVAITQTLTLFSDKSDSSHNDSEMHKMDKSLIKLPAEWHPVIGEIALCAHTPRSASVIATTDVTLGHFTSEDLEAVIIRDPLLGYLLYKNLASIIAERLVKANSNVIKLTTAFSLALQRGT